MPSGELDLDSSAPLQRALDKQEHIQGRAIEMMPDIPTHDAPCSSEDDWLGGRKILRDVILSFKC